MRKSISTLVVKLAKKTCPICNGKRVVWVYKSPRYGIGFRPFLILPPSIIFEKEKILCPKCKGEGFINE